MSEPIDTIEREGVTNERIAEVVEAARALVAAHEQAHPDRPFPSLNERAAYYMLLGVIA
jgi:hypothetical protein